MRAILIDPEARTITEVESSGHGDGPTGIHALIGTEGSPFDVRMLSPDESLYLDDEGLLKLEEGESHRFTEIDGQTFAGKLLVIGVDPEGDSAPTRLTVEQVRRVVGFSKRRYNGIGPITEREANHPVFGKTIHISQPANFGPPEEEE